MEFSIEFISIVIIHSIGEHIHPWSCVGYLDRYLTHQDMNKQLSIDSEDLCPKADCE